MAEAPPAPQQTIALVDDDRNILTTVSIGLQAEGFATRVYSDGTTALKALLVDSWYDAYLGVVVLVRVDAEADAGGPDLDVEGVEGRGAGAGVDLDLERGDAELRQADPLTPTDHHKGIAVSPKRHGSRLVGGARRALSIATLRPRAAPGQAERLQRAVRRRARTQRAGAA